MLLSLSNYEVASISLRTVNPTEIQTMKRIPFSLIIAGLLLPAAQHAHAADPSPSPRAKQTVVTRDRNVANPSTGSADSFKDRGQPGKNPGVSSGEAGGKIKSKPGQKRHHRIVNGYSAEFYAGNRIEGDKPDGQKKVKARSALQSVDKRRASSLATSPRGRIMKNSSQSPAATPKKRIKPKNEKP